MSALDCLLLELACAQSLWGGTKGQLNFSHGQDEMDEAITPGKEWDPTRRCQGCIKHLSQDQLLPWALALASFSW